MVESGWVLTDEDKRIRDIPVIGLPLGGSYNHQKWTRIASGTQDPYLWEHSDGLFAL